MASQSPVLDLVPVGFRFLPTDEELVGHYLKHKQAGDDFVFQVIREIDVCKHEPWDLPAFSEINWDDREWFFFSRLDFKYSNSTRLNRATKRGYWKVTGKDRNIKVRGTNDVIGTKKTLVFYEGRVPKGVKTNWVIHEYHDAKLDVNQRTFVLCRLMKKHEQKAADKVCDEGEPSNRMASSCVNQPSEGRIPEVPSWSEGNLDFCFPRSPQPEEYPIQFPLLPSSNIGNDNSGADFPFETTEEEDNLNYFADSFLIFNEERKHALVNDSIPRESLRMYYESSGSDAEVVSARYGNIPDTSAEKKVVSFQDDVWGVDTSSSDSTATRSPSTLRTCKTEHQPRSANSVIQRAGARRSQTQTKVSTKASYHEAQKETIKESNSKQRKAQGSMSRNTSEAQSTQSSDTGGRGSFIHMETPPLSQNLSPPSEYLVNVVLGFFLFIGIIWEIISCGKF